MLLPIQTTTNETCTSSSILGPAIITTLICALHLEPPGLHQRRPNLSSHHQFVSTGIFPDQFKNCSVHHHLKKSNLDKDDLGNYRPISHLPFLSKLTERVVKLRLADYLSTNNLLKFFPVCRYQKSFYRNYSSLRSWKHHQSHESSTSHMSHTSWFICFFWH